MQIPFESFSDVRRMRDLDIMLLAVLDRIRVVLNRPQPDQRQFLKVLVEQLAGNLDGNVRMKDELLYPQLLTSSSPGLRGVAQGIFDDFGGLNERFLAFRDSWAEEEMLKQWAGYCADFLALISEIRLRIDREESMLYPLLEAAHSAGSSQAQEPPFSD